MKTELSKEKYQELLESSYQDYNLSMETLNEMKIMVKKIDCNYDVIKAKMQFDAILQAILLNLAVADGNFNKLEQNFISSITDNCDLLDVINSRNDSNNYSWRNIEHLSKEETAELLKFVDEEIQSFLDDFVKPLAYIDAMTERDYLDEILSSISGIAFTMMHADGNIEKIEITAAREAVNNLFLAKYNYYKSNPSLVEKELKNSKSA